MRAKKACKARESEIAWRTAMEVLEPQPHESECKALCLSVGSYGRGALTRSRDRRFDMYISSNALGLEASTTTDTEGSSLVMSKPKLVYTISLAECVLQQSELVAFQSVTRPTSPITTLSDYSPHRWTDNLYLDLPDEFEV